MIRRLELGPGAFPTPGYDTADKGGPYSLTYTFDLAKQRPWPIASDLYDEVLAIHVIEHVSMSSAPSMFAEVIRLLKSGGLFRVHVPNGPAIAKTYLEQPGRRRELQMAIYGGEAEVDPAFGHKVLYDAGMLKHLLESSGFISVEDVSSSVEDRHDKGWTLLGGRMSLKVQARKP